MQLRALQRKYFLDGALVLATFLCGFAVSEACGDEKVNAKNPKVPVTFIDDTWEEVEAGNFRKENMEAADSNKDGRIDYFRVQDPPDSYVHFVWSDKNHDGVFDSCSGIGLPDGKIKISDPVPKVHRTQ